MDPRYARHLLLAEVGPAGQARLCAHRVVVSGDARAAAVARAYLQRAGVEPRERAEDAENAENAESDQEIPSASSAPPRSLRVPSPDSAAGRGDLAPAAAWLAGAFAAVEEIKRALDVGTPGSLDGVTLTGPPGDGA